MWLDIFVADGRWRMADGLKRKAYGLSLIALRRARAASRRNSDESQQSLRRTATRQTVLASGRAVIVHEYRRVL
jgi:uncharacterized membrane protein YccC